MACDTFEDTSEDQHSTRTITDELSTNRVSVLLAICAEDIMQKNIIWCEPDDSIQKVLEKMRSHRTDHVIIGTDQTIEGIVAKSELTGVVSPYLRSLAAKWRQSTNDITNQVEIKWIMNRQVHTINPETSCTDIMKTLRLFGRYALPVVDRNGKILGLVTPYNLLKVRALLKLESNPAVLEKQNVNTLY